MKKHITLRDGREVLLLGTAHVSSQSVDEVKEVLRESAPHVVCVELDAGRAAALKEEDTNWQNLDIISVIRRGRLLFLFLQVLLSSFQKRIAKENGIRAGDDMKTAILWAEEAQVPTALIDRDINITLRRAWRKSSLWQKSKLLSQILLSPFLKEETLTSESIEQLKQEDVLSHLMEGMARSLPTIKSVLVDERDAYLAASIWEQPHEKILAVLGVGHLEGVVRHLSDTQMSQSQAQETIASLSLVPRASWLSKALPWSLSALFVLALGWVFYHGGTSLGLEGLKSWFLVNGALAAVGAVFAGAHPVTWLVALVGAPFTSLTPLVGVGMLTALCETYFRKPRVRDFLSLPEDIATLKGFFSNRVAHILLIFFATSLGSSVGTFWGLGILATLGIS